MRKFVGQGLKRKEDARLVTGQSAYVDDIQLPGMLHMVVVRSRHAHARLGKIDLDRARRMPGVVAALDGADIRSEVGLLPCAGELPGLRIPAHYVLAVDTVRFVGEPVAAVVATDRYRAADAAEVVEIEYDPLPAVIDPETALAPDATRVHDEFPDNVAFRFAFENGDTDAAFRSAAHVVRQRFINQRLAPSAMEPRGVVATFERAVEQVVIWNSTQIPHVVKTQTAKILGISEARTRVIAPEVGGGFGSKLNFYPEDALVPYLARRLEQPVKWIESRRDNLAATTHGRDQIQDVELALDVDGHILGMRLRVVADTGAYQHLFTPIIPTLTGLLAPGCYVVPSLKVDMVGVFTNKMATDAYRGAGRPEATYLVERIMDMAALESGLDPVELRRRNFPPPDAFPYRTSGGVVYDSADYERALDKALDRADYAGLRRQQAGLRAEGRLMGIGVSTYVEICAMGPSSDIPTGGWESGQVRIEPSGEVTVLTGASPHGQGEETTFSQIAADEFGIDMDQIAVFHGDTARIPYGIGTFGSRGTAVGGTAMYLAIQDLKTKMSRIVAHLKHVDAGQVEFSDGRVGVPGGPSMSFVEVVNRAYSAQNLPDGLEPGLDVTRFFEPSNYTFPFGAHVAVVEVDAETGEITLKRYIAVDDCGNVINPVLVEGQVHGGIAQGVAQALHEEVIYDEQGQLCTGTLADYGIPRARDFPMFELDRTVTPSPVNPLGVKGVGEAGTIGSVPAVVNAVIDALAPFGVRHLDMPLRSEKLWKILDSRVSP
jgi:carbon-monoxide dehydrogenase large subunit